MSPSPFVQPDLCLCIEGLPSRTYTDSACLAALLLLVDGQRRVEQQHGAQSARPIGTYYPESILDVMDKKLIHHNHNSKVAQVLVGSGIKTIILMPSPGSMFANIYCSGVREDAKVARYINAYRDWLAILASCEQAPSACFLQVKQVADDPTIIAKTLSRLDLLGDSIAEEEVMDLFEFAVEMAPSVSEAKYGEGYDPFRSEIKVGELDEIGERFLLRHRGGAELIHDYLDASSALGLTKF